MTRDERNANLLNTLGNLLLTVLKLVIGTAANSQAVLADGVHNAADLLASGAVYVGVRVARVPADEAHPFGHQKAEAIAEDIVGILLILAGFEILISSLHDLISGPKTVPGIMAAVVMAFSLVLKEFMYRYNRRVGRRQRSRALLAVAVDHRVDVFASFAALVGAGGARFGFPWLDPLAGGVVSLFVIHSGWRLVVRAVDHLMDKFDDPVFLDRVQELVARTVGVRRVEGLRARRTGPSILLELEIAVAGEITVDEGHVIAHHVAERLSKELADVTSVHVHVNPATAEGTTSRERERQA